MCGDNLVNPAAGETCDLGAMNGQPGSACDANCKRANGQACPGGAGQCGSGFCVDGVCCNVACGSLCESCLGAQQAPGGMNGVCGFVANGQDFSNECPAPGDPMNRTACNGAGACVMP